MASFRREGKYSISFSGSPQPRRNTSGRRGFEIAIVRWSRLLGPICLQVSKPLTALKFVLAKTVLESCAPRRSPRGGSPR
jgi:hypothetical protein